MQKKLILHCFVSPLILQMRSTDGLLMDLLKMLTLLFWSLSRMTKLRMTFLPECPEDVQCAPRRVESTEGIHQNFFERGLQGNMSESEG